VAVDALRELGLTDNDVCVRYSSRQLVSAVLAELGLQEESQRAKVLAALDKRNKVPAEAFEKMLGDALSQQGLLDTDLSHDRLMKFLEISDVERATAEQIAGEIGIECSEAIRAAVADLGEFRRHLAEFGIEGWCAYDAGIVRGLAYYTGIVYEVFDRSAALRAVAGGGRYANLLEVLGGPAVSATGFGMGDVVLSILLEEKGLLGEELTGGELDLFLIDADEADLPAVLGLAAELRRCGLRCDYSFRRQAIGKQLKEASRRGSRGVVILEPGGGEVSVKNLATGEQAKEPTEAFRQRASQIARAEDLLP
jgi:histidyl-tRNA synthetase